MHSMSVSCSTVRSAMARQWGATPASSASLSWSVGQGLSRKRKSLAFAPEAGGPLDDLIGHSIAYRVAFGPRAGQKVFTLQTVPQREEESRKRAAQYAGFSLHAGVGVEAEQREKLERLARYVSRPAVSMERTTPKHVAMSRAARLKRVFGIDIERCRGCGGRLKVIASIE
jgi:Putative transposase